MRTGGSAMSGGAMRTGEYTGVVPIDMGVSAYRDGRRAVNAGKRMVKKARSLIHY